VVRLALMGKSRVVLATGDEWVANLIGAVLRDAGLDVVKASTAHETLELLPRSAIDAVIADAALPDDPAWLVTQIRLKPLSFNVPFLLLAHADDSFSRMEALRAGADVCLTKPFRADELCLQVLATIAMAQRYAGSPRPVSNPRNVALRTPLPSAPTAALAGDLSMVSLATVLSLLELERRSGSMTIRGPKHNASLVMRGGSAARATLGGVSTSIIAVLRRVLRWKSGHFEFQPDEPSPSSVPPSHHSIGALLIEAARLDDEMPSSRRSESVLPPPSDELDVLTRREEARLEPSPASPRVAPTRPLASRRGSAPPPAPRKAGIAPAPSSPPPSRRSLHHPSIPPPAALPAEALGRPATAQPAAEKPAAPSPGGPASERKPGPPRPAPKPGGPPRPRGSGSLIRTARRGPRC
jgi:two-component system, OmpR family, response regulator